MASLKFNFIFVIVTYIIGLLNLGFIVPLLVLIKGGLLGFNVGYLIYNFGLKGFIVSVLGLYPQYLLFIPCIIAIAALVMTMSFKYKLSAKRRTLRIKRMNLADYTVSMLFFTCIMFIGSVYEGYVSPIFLNLINELL